jgi:hypothetical protein
LQAKERAVSPDGFSRSTKPGNTSVQLLQAACELLGGEERLAERLEVSRSLLRWFMAGKHELPSKLLLTTVDILEERESGFPPAAQATLSASGSPDGTDLPA